MSNRMEVINNYYEGHVCAIEHTASDLSIENCSTFLYISIVCIGRRGAAPPWSCVVEVLYITTASR